MHMRLGKMFRTGVRRAAYAGAVLLAAGTAHAETVTFSIDATANVKPISRYIYGINETLGGTAWPNLTLRRAGGNRWTAYNWVNNASNAGSDYIFQNDNYLGGGNIPGGAVIPAITNASAQKAALLLTIPIQGYVAADKKGDGDVHDSGANYLKTRFRQERAVKGAAFTVTPSQTTPLVYQDEYVNWVKTKYPYSQTDPLRPIWFSLDNEPDLWAETHQEVHPAPPRYSELVTKGTNYAKAAKAVAPNSLVFGPVSYGWYGYTRLQGAPDANDRDFLLYYLQQMKAQSTAAGKRLLDVLDLHWYPEVRVGDYHDGTPTTGAGTSPAVIAARVQSPRSLWDPSYQENSWIVHDDIQQPIQLIPRMLNKIALGYAGTKLAFTEYNYGAGAHISGAIAQADVLGIFGKYGVFAAAQFPLLDGPETFVRGAFKMYRDFNGANGSFGDRSVKATTSSIVDTSVYASLDSTNPKRMVVVAINKTSQAITGAFTLSHAMMTTMNAYKLTSASANPLANGGTAIAVDGTFNYTLPAYSVNTLLLRAP
jgi:hypothetical protein